MRKILATLCLIIGFNAMGQNKDQILLEKALALTETYNLVYNEYYDKLNEETTKIFEDAFTKRALEYLNEIISDYPDSKFYTNALFSKAELEYMSNDKNAKSNLQKVLLRSDANKRELSYSNLYLAQIFIAEKDYKSALNYPEKHAQFPGPTGCGNAIETHWKRIENL